MDASPATVIATSSMKGGAGKTSVTVNMAGLAASRGYRVLLIDADPQGNAGLDLGYKGSDVDDDGAGLVAAAALNKALRVVSSVRPGLDVVPGGSKVEMLAYIPAEDPAEKMRSLHVALEPLRTSYDLVLIDCPPLVRPLREMCLAAATFSLIPTRGDAASVEGVTGIAADFTRVRPVNPDLELLGVVLFGMGASSSAIRANVRAQVSEGLGAVAPVFDEEIRYMEGPAVAARNRGLLVHEYAQSLLGSASFTERKKGESAAKLANDYARLTAAVMAQAATRLAQSPSTSSVKVAAR